jgi:hypothetical protein
LKKEEKMSKRFLFTGSINAGCLYDLKEKVKYYGWWDCDEDEDLFVAWDCDVEEFYEDEINNLNLFEFNSVCELDEGAFTLVVKEMEDWIRN